MKVDQLLFRLTDGRIVTEIDFFGRLYVLRIYYFSKGKFIGASKCA